MKKLLSILLTLALCLGLMPAVAVPVSAADIFVTVGDGTYESKYVPTYTLYNYSKSQVVVPSSKLVDLNGKTITGISYYPYGASKTRNIEIRLSEINEESLTAFVDATTAAMVYSGEVNFDVDAGRTDLTFSTPYEYKGGNLLITVIDNTGTWSSGLQFYGVNETGASWSYYRDGEGFSPAYASEGQQRNSLPKMTFYGESASPAPTVYYDLYICGTQVTSENAGDLSVIDGVSGNVSYNDSTKTLTLKNATITGKDSITTTIAVGTADLTIAFSGTNTITARTARTSSDYCRGIDAYLGGGNGTLTLAGEENATLTVQTTHNNSPENGAIRGDSLIVTGGTVICVAPEEAYKNDQYKHVPYAISLNGNSDLLSVTGGKLICKAWAPLAFAVTDGGTIDSNTVLQGSDSYDGSGLEPYDYDNNGGYASGSWQKTYCYVEAVSKGSYNITIGPGKYMTKKSGQESQSVSSGEAITDVVYTADEGYYFPTDYSTVPVNDIGITRDSFTQITVSGMPTANTTFYPADATKKNPAEIPTGVDKTDCTTENNNDGKITGVDNTMEYQKSGNTGWTAIMGSEVDGLIPGTYSVRVKETDTALASDAATVTIAEYKALPKVETPVFDPAATSFEDSIDVKISCVTTGAAIHFTLDGSTPTANSEITTGAAITLNATTTIKAIAVLDGYENSAIATATYTKNSPSAGGGGGIITYPVKPASAENGSVTVAPRNAAEKAKVTITINPDEGYVLDKLTVKDKDGNEIAVRDNGDGTYTFTMPASAIEIEATFKPDEDAAADDFPFVDVPENSYFHKPVEWAVEKGITNGVSEDKYGPEMSCTRAQVVTFLWITCGSEDAGIETGFDDVDVSAYYDKAVAWAVEKGITAGTSENEFSPDVTVTRAQFVTMLWAAKGMPEAAGEMPFLDVPTDAYYAKAVAWAYANDITAGKSADSFAPDDPCTRAQIMTFLYNAYGE